MVGTLVRSFVRTAPITPTTPPTTTLHNSRRKELERNVEAENLNLRMEGKAIKQVS